MKTGFKVVKGENKEWHGLICGTSESDKAAGLEFLTCPIFYLISNLPDSHSVPHHDPEHNSRQMPSGVSGHSHACFLSKTRKHTQLDKPVITNYYSCLFQGSYSVCTHMAERIKKLCPRLPRFFQLPEALMKWRILVWKIISEPFLHYVGQQWFQNNQKWAMFNCIMSPHTYFIDYYLFKSTMFSPVIQIFKDEVVPTYQQNLAQVQLGFERPTMSQFQQRASNQTSLLLWGLQSITILDSMFSRDSKWQRPEVYVSTCLTFQNNDFLKINYEQNQN
ncbi:hypothetical protein VP01_679g2 [Puccinia sorghi]|uniref:Uncharacterized protein n=1 Tax=Puccinia sorghi TaxID=27349 RepID=A0A0L6UFE0_9BASI|nr:hypothetical protein VP01_679g2 [Puccinia sorghi]